MADNSDPLTPGDADADEGEMSEVEIDRNLADSFPASDPPSWTLGTNHGAESHQESPDKPSSESEDSEAE